MTLHGDIELFGASAYVEFSYTPPVRPTINDDGCDEDWDVQHLSIEGSRDVSETLFNESAIQNAVYDECVKLVKSEMHEAQLEASRRRKAQLEDGFDLDGVA